MRLVRPNPESDDGSAHNETIDLIAARTGYAREVVKHVLEAHYRQLLHESRGNPVILEDLGAVLVPEGFPADVEFVVHDELER